MEKPGGLPVKSQSSASSPGDQEAIPDPGKPRSCRAVARGGRGQQASSLLLGEKTRWQKLQSFFLSPSLPKSLHISRQAQCPWPLCRDSRRRQVPAKAGALQIKNKSWKRALYPPQNIPTPHCWAEMTR